MRDSFLQFMITYILVRYNHVMVIFLLFLFIYLFIYLFFNQLFWTQACPDGMGTNGTQVPCEAPSLPNPTNR